MDLKPDYIEKYIPYATINRRMGMWRAILSSRLEYSKYLIENTFNIDADRVVDVFISSWDQSKKDYPSPKFSRPSSPEEYDSYNKYIIYLWEYYVNDNDKIELPEEPTESTEKKDSSAIVPVNKSPEDEKDRMYDGVREDDLVDEEIDERILRILGLEDTFDIDYATYKTLLKEYLVKISMGSDSLPREEQMLLRDEYIRVKRLVGRFKINKKYKDQFGSPITLASSSIINPESIKTPDLEQQNQNQTGFSKFAEDIASIRDSVANILELMQKQNDLFKKQIDNDRKSAEKSKRQKNESRLESVGKGALKLVNKVLGPVKNIFEKLLKFITTVILGRIVLQLFRWMSDPKNKGKVDAIFRFLKDWGPALIAGYLLFGTAIGRLVRTVIGTLVKLTFAILRKGIPAAMNLIRKNPKAAAAIGLFTAGATIPMLFPDTVDAEEKKTESAPGTKEEKIEALKKQKENLNPMQKMQGVGSEIDEQIYKLETGETKSYSGGGEIPKLSQETISKFPGGTVTNQTGVRVKGAGKDTQLTALEPGEIVISNAAVNKYGSDFFLSLNKSGGGTNNPKIASGIQLASGGGMIGSFTNNRSIVENVNNNFSNISKIRPTQIGLDSEYSNLSKYFINDIQNISSNNPSYFSNLNLTANKRVDNNTRNVNNTFEPGQVTNNKNIRNNNFIGGDIFNNLDTNINNKEENNKLDVNKFVGSNNANTLSRSTSVINSINNQNNMMESGNDSIGEIERSLSAEKYIQPFTKMFAVDNSKQEQNQNIVQSTELNKIDSGKISFTNKNQFGSPTINQTTNRVVPASISREKNVTTQTIPPPPKPKVNLVHIANEEIQKIKSQKSVGKRDLDTNFPAAYPSNTRSMLIQTYGIYGVR